MCRRYLSPMRNCIFSVVLSEESFMIWSSILGLFQSFCNHQIFVYLNLPIFPVLVRRREKSQKCFYLLAVKQILIHSNPSSTLDAMNFQKWEHFSGSPGIIVFFHRGLWKSWRKCCDQNLQIHLLIKDSMPFKCSSGRMGVPNHFTGKCWGVKTFTMFKMGYEFFYNHLKSSSALVPMCFGAVA